MNTVKSVASAVVAVGNFIVRNARKLGVALVTVVSGSVASAQTDATVIATNAQSAFAIVAPITITIVGFYVILKIARRVVG